MSRVDHGTMFYKAVKSGIVDPEDLGADRHSHERMRTPLGVNIIDAREVHALGAGGCGREGAGDCRREAGLSQLWTLTGWTPPLRPAPAPLFGVV